MNKNNKNLRTKNKSFIYKRHKIYEYVIKSPIVNYVTPEYELTNLKFDVYAILTSTQVFTALAKNYLQYNLKRVTFMAIPRSVDGTDPAPIWIYLDINGQTSNFNYADMPELQGSKLLPVKRYSMTSYRSTGRQNDFHYWYDMSEYNSTLAIRLHSAALPNEKKFWQFQIGFVVQFRGFTVEVSNNKKILEINKQTDIKFISSESKKFLDEPDLTEEEEKELWEHEDSDWDDSLEEHKVEVTTGSEPISNGPK